MSDELVPTAADAAVEPGSRSRATAVQALRMRGTHWLLVGSVIAGIAAYVFQIVAARALGEVQYAPISSLWTLQYLGFTVLLYPVEAYMARESAAHPSSGISPRLWLWILAVATAAASVSWVGRNRLLGGDATLAVAAGVIIASYGPFAVTRGRLAGFRRFRAYGLVTASESVIRVALLVPVVVAGATTRSVAWTMAWGAAVSGAAWPWLRKRFRRPQRRSGGAGRGTVRFLATTSVANAISQILLAVGPLVVGVLGGTAEEISVFFVTVTAARAPLVLAFGGVLSRLLPVFTRVAARPEGRAMLAKLAWRIVAATFGLAAVAAAAGAWIGDEVVILLFGAEFAPPGWLVGGAEAAVIVIGGATVLNQMLIAEAAERSMLAPWVGALCVAAVTLAVVQGPVAARVIAGMNTGGLVALVALALAIRQRTFPRSPATAASL